MGKVRLPSRLGHGRSGRGGHIHGLWFGVAGGCGCRVGGEPDLGHALGQRCTAWNDRCRGCEDRLADIAPVVAIFGVAIAGQATALAVGAVAGLREVVRAVKHHTANIGQGGRKNKAHKEATIFHGGRDSFLNVIHDRCRGAIIRHLQPGDSFLLDRPVTRLIISLSRWWPEVFASNLCIIVTNGHVFRKSTVRWPFSSQVTGLCPKFFLIVRTQLEPTR